MARPLDFLPIHHVDVDFQAVLASQFIPPAAFDLHPGLHAAAVVAFCFL